MKTFSVLMILLPALTIVVIIASQFAYTSASPVGKTLSPHNIKRENKNESDRIDEMCPENINNDNITNIKWYRYHNESKRCYHVDERGPCGVLMLFYRVGDSEYGDCDCNFYYRCGRPLIYWPPKNRCYFVNDQGPCEEEEWLVFGDRLQPACQSNPCIKEQVAAPSTPKEFWFEYSGECYRTNTNGYCEDPQAILYNKWEDYHPSCNVGIHCDRNSRSNRAGSPSCLPGQRQDTQGNCKKVAVVRTHFGFAAP